MTISEPNQSTQRPPVIDDRARRWAFRAIAGFVLFPGGALCLLLMPAQLFMSDGPMLWPDTRAFFGAGTSEGVPTVSQVHCAERQYGTRRTGFTLWECTLFLVSTPSPQPADPYGGMNREQAAAEYARLYAEFSRRIAARADPAQRALAIPDRIERELSANLGGRIPTLRRLSAPNEPPVFGVVWKGSELFEHWVDWAITYVLIFGWFGAGCLVVGVWGWKETRFKAGG